MTPKQCVLLLVTLLVCGAPAEEPPEAYLNLTSGNSLWTSLVTNCRKPTMACVEKSMYAYLRDTLDYPSDFQVTSFLKFTQNRLDYDAAKKRYGESYRGDTHPDDGDGDFDDGSRSSLEEMSRSLHDRSVKFLMTHDVEVQLPQAIFEGTILKFSPRGFEENGALVKLEISTREVAEGRIFKKIKKFIGERLLFALLAILLVIKLLAAKFMFFMPMVVGAVTAKKLLIKVLLFLFPALKWLFKLCAYAPQGAKYHHHHHQIAHIHHVGHGHHGPHHHHHGPHHGGVEVVSPHADGPPDSHHYEEDDGPHWHGPPAFHHSFDGDDVHHHKPLYQPHEQELEYYSGGPALSYHLATHRQDEKENEIHPWGQGQKTRKKSDSGRPLSPTEIENAVLKAEKEALIKARLQQEQLRIQQENARLQEQLKQALKLQEKLRLQQQAVKSRISQPGPGGTPGLLPPPPPGPFSKNPSVPPPPPAAPAKPVPPNYQQTQPHRHQPNSYQIEPFNRNVQNQQPKQPVQQPQDNPNQPYQNRVDQQYEKPQTMSANQKQEKEQVQASALEKALQKAASITYDPFYSPILEKIDKILNGLGFTDEPCRERLICSMYKNPVKFSPHSNLLSAELSRDSSELQKPKSTNAVVIRFYRYVQAARDGQDKRECLRLYAGCSVITE